MIEIHSFADMWGLLMMAMPYIITWWIIWFTVIVPWLLFTEKGQSISRRFLVWWGVYGKESKP